MCAVPSGPAVARVSRPELADIVRAHGAAYRRTHRLVPVQQRALRAIATCRTAALGGHRETCDHCGAVYSGIDRKLRALLGVDVVEHAEPRRVLASTHGIYRAMHWTIAAILFAAALGMLLYGWGYFQELPHRSENAG